MSGEDDVRTGGARNFKGPYTSKHPIPTISKYREEKKERQEYANQHHGEDTGGAAPYADERREAQEEEREERHETRGNERSDDDEEEVAKDTSQADVSTQDPRQQRKQMKKRKDKRAEREVTDPVTHLPVSIHDFTSKDLDQTPHNEPPAGSQVNSSTGATAAMKSKTQQDEDETEQQLAHNILQEKFPPPSFDAIREQSSKVFHQGLMVGLLIITSLVAVVGLLITIFKLYLSERWYIWFTSLGAVVIGVSAVTIYGIQGWTKRKVQSIWDDEVWESERQAGKDFSKQHRSETTQWLNSLLASVWPLVNPDLFTSIADTLEDVMQASLPKMVRMISVEDIGQGSESIRILGVRWLPTGAAAKSVGKDGKLKSDEDPKKSDRTVPGKGEVSNEVNDDDDDDDGGANRDADGKDDTENDPEKQQNEENIAEGMEAESGDFVNIEVAFSYRSRGKGKGMHSRAKNAHLYLAFYLYAGIKFRK
jgi:Ca2+-dependent lipid-binding protein